MKKIMDLLFEEEVVQNEIEVELVKISDPKQTVVNQQKYEEKLNTRPKREMNINLSQQVEKAFSNVEGIQVNKEVQIKKAKLVETPAKPSVMVSPIFGPTTSKQENGTSITASNSVNQSVNNGIISPFYGVLKATQEIKEQQIDLNPYGMIEEIKKIDVIDVEGSEGNEVDFFQDIIVDDEQRTIIATDISLFDE